MTEQPIPREVELFIRRYIDSIAQLEALLLLYNNPTLAWNAASVAKRLYTNEVDAQAILVQLFHDGLLTDSDGVFQYSCKSSELKGSVERLSLEYSRNLIAITNMVHAKPRRIRQFADAFRLRKDR